MLYFAYGSNMSCMRLQQRLSSARVITTATLFGHNLRFHKIGKDLSGKCDALETGQEHHAVMGVVYDIAAAEKPLLDRHEGLGYGYNEKPVAVTLASGDIIEAFTYCATNIDHSLKPYHWYKEHVLRGARENGLPESYVRYIAAIESITDPVNERHATEMAIYMSARNP